ncbi:acyl-CoA dehydrogenase [Burkholderiaceae bacterium UC74_6]
MRDTLDFLLFDWLRVQQLCERDRYAEHGRESFSAVLDACEKLARERFAPLNRLIDEQEPRFENGRVVLPAAVQPALQAFVDSGLLMADVDAEQGGMQLPAAIAMAGNAFFAKASVALHAYMMLTHGNAGLLLAHGSKKQIEVFAQAELEGRWFGTMCLSEPQAGSSLSDITTRAEPDGADFESDPLGVRYKLRGHKMWISGGEHELSENIVHLVLAKIPDVEGRLTAGTKGISLFIVPKWKVDASGALTGEHNDVQLAGLNHKLGYRGTTNCLLNFGEQGGAAGYLVGKPGEGLRCMFHMMNEARIAVGMGATMLGYAGYEASLEYARQRPQGRALGAKDPGTPQRPIIEHADVRRMLLAQKSYVEGGLALGLYCARLLDEQRCGTPEAAREATLLLEILTPVAKSFGSEWGLEANSLAIQVLGGAGYTRDFPVEQYWRDNRLNMIHEGTHGIQGLDLLGRKLLTDNGAAMKLLAARIQTTIAAAPQNWRERADQLSAALELTVSAAGAAWVDGDAGAALANATPFLQAFGHLVVGWLWLDIVSSQGSDSPKDKGRSAAAHYFYSYELTRLHAWLGVVSLREGYAREVGDDGF